jgi:hypothetical protein
MIMSIPRMTEVGLRDWLVEVISGTIALVTLKELASTLLSRSIWSHVEIKSWKNRHVYCTSCILSDTMMVDGIVNPTLTLDVK